MKRMPAELKEHRPTRNAQSNHGCRRYHNRGSPSRDTIRRVGTKRNVCQQLSGLVGSGRGRNGRQYRCQNHTCCRFESQGLPTRSWALLLLLIEHPREPVIQLIATFLQDDSNGQTRMNEQG
jgi:hypothetical protein